MNVSKVYKIHKVSLKTESTEYLTYKMHTVDL